MLYQQGLTGKAAEWAVNKQKSTQKIPERLDNRPWWVVQYKLTPQGHIEIKLLVQKIVPTENIVGKPAKTGFGCFQPPWEWFQHPFVPKKSRSGTSKIVDFACPALYYSSTCFSCLGWCVTCSETRLYGLFWWQVWTRARLCKWRTSLRREEGAKAIRFNCQRWAFNELQVHYFQLVQ